MNLTQKITQPFALCVAFTAGSLTATAQNSVTFDSVVYTSNSKSGREFRAVEDGTTRYDEYNAFLVHVASGTGTGAGLVGQDFYGICANFNYPVPSPGISYSLATDGSNLGYDPDEAGPSGDQWNVNRAEKYAAIRDIVASWGGTVAALDPDSLEFQQRIVALNFVVAKITADYDLTLASLNLNTGYLRFENQDGSPLSTSSGVYQYYQEALGTIGSGAGDNYPLFASATNATNGQDLILIPVNPSVPEPTTPLLFGSVAVLSLLRRRRLPV